MESNCPYAKQLSELLDVYNLKQHIHEPTHIKGNILDLVITENRDNYFQDATISRHDVSDHFLVSFRLATKLASCSSKEIRYRSIKKVDMDQFNKMVATKLDALPVTKDLKAKVRSYNTALRQLVDEVAPVKSKVIKLVPNAPWFDEEYANIRKLRRKAEKRYRRTGLERHRVEYMVLKKDAIRSAFEKKKSFISRRLEEDSGKSLFKIVNELTDSKKETVLPTGKSDKELANNFLIYFKEKIEKIRNKFKHPSSDQNYSTDPMIEKMSEFEPATLEEIIRISKSYGVKCSPEDPVPASLLSSCIETFAPYWLEIVNLSLELGDMDGLKNAVLIPLIKELNSTVDTENYKNYRPVSNLLFVSKLIERIVQTRLEKHMIRNGLVNDKNYAYSKNHSTEHLLLKVVNDLYLAFDQSQPTVVVLLDLSAAFDTVDHSKLLYILEHEIGIIGTSLRWFESFLKGRGQKVKIGEEYSEILELLYGVAQGSVLGPQLFKIYIRSLYKYVEPTKYTIEGFADDHQLIKQFLISLQVKALGVNIQDLLLHIGEWMNEYFLCLNQSKTKILVIAPPSLQPEIIIRGIFLENTCIRFVDSAKNLGIVLDNVLSFDVQVNKIVKSCYLTIKNITLIKNFLSESQMKQLVCARIFSLLDYCNSLYYGINTSLISKLQRVQNNAAKLIYKNRIPRSQMNDKFLNLHWLKIKYRIIFKILLIVHNCLKQTAPKEIISLLELGDSNRTLHLKQTRTLTKYGDRAFSHMGPKLWNMLPMKIRAVEDTESFKKNLKSFLLLCGDIYD